MQSNWRNAMPSHGEIRRHWATRLVELGKFDSIEEACEADYCFACGALPFDGGKTHRAHIVAHCVGGDETPANLHLLCSMCHRDSELLHGARYWVWLQHRNVFDVLRSHAVRAGATLTKFQDAEYTQQMHSALMLDYPEAFGLAETPEPAA